MMTVGESRAPVPSEVAAVVEQVQRKSVSDPAWTFVPELGDEPSVSLPKIASCVCVSHAKSRLLGCVVVAVQGLFIQSATREDVACAQRHLALGFPLELGYADEHGRLHAL